MNINLFTGLVLVIISMGVILKDNIDNEVKFSVVLILSIVALLNFQSGFNYSF